MVMREVVTVQMQTVVIREVVVVGEESRLEFPMAPFVPDRNHGTGQPRARLQVTWTAAMGDSQPITEQALPGRKMLLPCTHRLLPLACVRSLFSRFEFSSFSSSSLLTQRVPAHSVYQSHLGMKRLCSASLIGSGFLS